MPARLRTATAPASEATDSVLHRVSVIYRKGQGRNALSLISCSGRWGHRHIIWGVNLNGSSSEFVSWWGPRPWVALSYPR